MNAVTMARQQVHVTSKSGAGSLLIQPPACKSRELRSAPGPHVQPFTSMTFSSIVCNPACALEILLGRLPGLIALDSESDGWERNWKLMIGSCPHRPEFASVCPGQMEPIFKSCPYLFSGFWPPPPFRVPEALTSMSECCTSSSPWLAGRPWVGYCAPLGLAVFIRRHLRPFCAIPRGSCVYCCVTSCTAWSQQESSP